MNDAERTAMAAWAEGIAALATESGGVLDVVIVRPPAVPALFEAALAGDPEAVRLAHAVFSVIERVEGAEAVLCASCDTNLADTAFSVVITMPSHDDPARGLALGVCSDCATERDDVLRKAVRALRDVFPHIRHVEMQGHEAGHA